MDENDTQNEDKKDNTSDFTSKIVGDFGPWQLKISILMALLKFPIAWYQLDVVFLAPPQEFWCEKPEAFIKYSDREWRDFSSPKVEEHPCLIYDPEILISAPYVDKQFIPLVPCTKFVYDHSVFNRTITSEWNLVCHRHWLVHLSQCVLMWGVLIGGIAFGAVADRYGRKIPLTIAIFVQAFSSFVSSMIPWYWGFVVNRFILALASGGIGVISFVICVEIVGGKYRTIIPILYHLPFGFGNSIMAALAYWLRDWRKLEFCLACLSSLYLAYWYLVPESPRWLIAKAKDDQALEILKEAAKTNGRDFRPQNFQSLISHRTKPQVTVPGFLDFIKSKNMRTKTMLLSVNWLCTGLAFYAFSQHLGSIAENIFLTVSACGIISTPGALICVCVINKWGRKKTIVAFQIVTALCFLLILVTPKDVFVNDWPRLFFAGVGFAGMAGTVPALYLFSGETFPTLGRNVGVAGVSTFARIGSMLAPGLVAMETIQIELPVIILTVMSLAQTLLVIPMPETSNCPLPDTLEQAEKTNKKLCQGNKEQNIIRQNNK